MNQKHLEEAERLAIDIAAPLPAIMTLLQDVDTKAAEISDALFKLRQRACDVQLVVDQPRFLAVARDLVRSPVGRRLLKIGDAIGQLDHPHLVGLALDASQTVFHLGGLAGEGVILGQRGDTGGDIGTERGVDRCDGHLGIFDHVVQQSALDRQVRAGDIASLRYRRHHLHCDTAHMVDVGALAAGNRLPDVGFRGEVPRG